MRPVKFSVYIMATDNNRVLYVGVTNDVRKRAYEHRDRLNHGFTYKYNVNKLVYYESFDYIDLAIRREKQLKNWKREWKDNLIKRFNPDWKDLLDSL